MSSEFSTASALLRSLLHPTRACEHPEASMSECGGPPFIDGDILDHPQLLWADVCLDERRIQHAEQQISLQGPPVTQFWKEKYSVEASKYWHKFYQRNRTNFYKDRHYLHIVFPELSPSFSWPHNGLVHMLEVGSGVGNAILPLLEIHPALNVTAVDFASSAIELLKQHPTYQNSGRCQAYVCDVSKEPLPAPEESFDVILCLFVLSALPPTTHAHVFEKLLRALKPGGKLCIRDYGRYDEAELRFKKGSKLGDHHYVRQDGTTAYYFGVDELSQTCSQIGFTPEECYPIVRQYANRLQKQARFRVWIHAKFRKPNTPDL